MVCQCHQWDVEVVLTCNMSLTKCLLWLADNLLFVSSFLLAITKNLLEQELAEN
jgi:hypothetical protein